MTAPDLVTSAAVLSPCGRYRYRLERRWSDAPPACWVMLNPSTADAEVDDATIRRCMAFARAWNRGGIIVHNLYALRATDPRDLWAADDPVGPDNDDHLAHVASYACTRSLPIIAAWGANARPDRVASVLAFPYMADLLALGVTKSGAPRHPLYLRSDCTPQPWNRTPVGVAS